MKFKEVPPPSKGYVLIVYHQFFLFSRYKTRNRFYYIQMTCQKIMLLIANDKGLCIWNVRLVCNKLSLYRWQNTRSVDLMFNGYYAAVFE